MVRGVLYLCATFSAGETFPSNPRWFTSSSWLTVPFVLFFTSQDKLQAKLDDFCKQNMKASSDYCMVLIQDSFHPLYEDVKQGTFSKPGCYYIFIKKMNELKDKYHQVPRKGVQVNYILITFSGASLKWLFQTTVGTTKMQWVNGACGFHWQFTGLFNRTGYHEMNTRFIPW